MLDFTLQSYAKFLARLVGTRDFPTFSQMPGIQDSESFIILRHDIDFCPKSAYEMAKLEASIGVSSTFFFLLSSPAYNLLAPDFVEIPYQIASLGHEVGLHYDVHALGPFGEEGLRCHAEMLGKMIGQPIKSIARHMPSIKGDDPFSRLPGFVDAYDPAFTQEITYISDSARAWRNNAAAILEAGPLPGRMQLLIHPILWTEERQDRWECLASFYREQSDNLSAAHLELAGLWRQHAGVLEHDARVGKGNEDAGGG